MPRKQPNGNGSIFRYRKGWRLQLSIPQPDGTTRRVTRSAPKQSELVAIREQLLATARAAALAKSECPFTLRQWLFEWLDAGRATWRDNTARTYRHAVEKWIVDRAGSWKLARLGVREVRMILENCAKDGAGGRTVQLIREVLMSACNLAVAENHIAANPVLGVAKPKADKSTPIIPFTSNEVQLLISGSRGHAYHGMVSLALLLGLRWGELAGLRRDDVDLKNRTVLIAGQMTEVWGKLSRGDTKTDRSRRTLTLPDEAIRALIDHERIMMKRGFADRDLMFVTVNGFKLRRANFGGRWWAQLQASHGIERRGFHHCRHTAITALLRAGVSVEIVSRMAGHSSAEFTLRTYSHFIPSDHGIAVQAINAMTGGGGCYHVATKSKREQA